MSEFNETEQARLSARALEIMPTEGRGAMMHRFLTRMYEEFYEELEDDSKAALLCVGAYIRCAIDAELDHPEYFYRDAPRIGGSNA